MNSIYLLKASKFVVVESHHTRQHELLRLCARVGYSPH